jgi:hypothetical protein
MFGKKLALCALLLFGTTLLAAADSKQSSTGVSCNSTGTARKDGKDQDGNKMNCSWDTCTYCGTTSGTIDCSKQITEYSNPTDCHSVASTVRPNGGGVLNHSPITTTPSTQNRKAQ